MLTESDLLTQDELPTLTDIGLSLYRDFSRNTLFAREFHYFFDDGTDVLVRFAEYGVYHMLAIQHINSRIPKNSFFARIDQGLALSDFELENAMRQRFKAQKTRIRLFACVYQALRMGQVFHCPDGRVPNTKDVEMDYIILREVSQKGLNVGLRLADDGSCYVPLTILVSKPGDIKRYVDGCPEKRVRRLEITEGGKPVERIVYADSFIAPMQP